MSQEAYPLAWPAGSPRTKYPVRSKFIRSSRSYVTLTQALDGIEEQLGKIGAKNSLVSTNLLLRLDGRPRQDMREPVDKGAAVYFTLKGNRTVLACDKWDRVPCNIWAIAKHIEALRGQERWGVGTMEQAFAGYKALNAPGQADPWDLLGITPDATEEQILAAYRQKARTAHPDAGGSAPAFHELTQAKDICLATLKHRGGGR